MTTKISIRAVQNADLPLVLSWRNSVDVRSYMYSRHKISPEEHQKWFDATKANADKYILLVEEGNKPFGFVQLERIRFGEYQDTASWGFYAKPGSPKGTGKKIGSAGLNFGFEKLGLHKIVGEALKSNCASVNLHRSLGFVQEGVLREHLSINGELIDLICFGMLKSEWISKSENEHERY